MAMSKNEESKTTTHYWGYRELSAEELLKVGGGDGDGDGDGDGGDSGGGDCGGGDCGDGGADGGGYGDGEEGGLSADGVAADDVGMCMASSYSDDNANAQLGAAIDLAFTSPVMAIALTGMALNQLVDDGLVGPVNPENVNQIGDRW